MWAVLVGRLFWLPVTVLARAVCCSCQLETALRKQVAQFLLPLVLPLRPLAVALRLPPLTVVLRAQVAVWHCGRVALLEDPAEL